MLTSSKSGVFLQSDYFNKQVASRDNTGYKVIRRGQFTYRAMSDTGEFFPNMLECTDIGIVSPAYPVFEITKPDIIIPEYLKYFFKSDVFQYSIASFAQGSTRTSIKFGKLKTVTINLPSIGEQERAVTVLDKTIAVVEARSRGLQALDDLIKARFVEMFGDPVQNEKKWSTRPLLSMGSCKNGMNFHYEDSGVEINCLGVGDFKNHSIIVDTAKLPKVSLNEMTSLEYLLQDDDIVFVRSNGNKQMVGRSVAVYPGTVPTTFSGFCIRYRRNSDEVITPYLLRVLKADSVRQQMYGRGANIQNLNQQTLSSLNIPVPPKVMQEQFALFVAQVDKSKVVVQKALDAAQLLFDKELLQQKCNEEKSVFRLEKVSYISEERRKKIVRAKAVNANKTLKGLRKWIVKNMTLDDASEDTDGLLGFNFHGMIQYMMTDSLRYKQIGFREEKEWRLFLGDQAYKDPKWVVGEGCDGVGPRGFAETLEYLRNKIEFSISDNNISPYVPLPFAELEEGFVKEVWIGPKSRIAKKDIELYLAKCGYNDVSVQFSQTSYR